MNINIISRGKGQSAVAAAAYRAAEIHKNDYDGQVHDYTHKNDLVYDAILLPDHAPAEYNYRTNLWNAVEQVEKAKNAQLAREVRVALPVEFDIWENMNLLHDYVKHNFVNKGMCADICIHDKGDGNPHAHILLTMRPLEQDGTWGAKSKMEYILDDNGERQKLPSGRYKVKKVTTTDWDSRDNAELWRKNWADTLNKHLEGHGHETTVDHRSYERQGLEQLPTIHLGKAAHQMEQKGIDTERGDINRNIKAANAQLKTLNADIRTTKKERHEILNPPKPQFIINLEKSIKAQDSPSYANWAKIFNLQQMAQTLLFIQTNGYDDMQSLRSAYLNAVNDYNAMVNQLPEIKQQLKDLKALKTQVEIYRKTADTYKKYTAPGQFDYFKNKYYDKHKTDIEAHKKAKAYIYDELKLTKFPNLKKLSSDIAELTANEKGLRESLPTAKEKHISLNAALHNARMLLGYHKLEEQGVNPVEIPHDHQNLHVYTKSFIYAEKEGELTQYFQSMRLDKECAEAIQAAKTIFVSKATIEQLINEYGTERVGWVLAAAVQYDNSNILPHHVNWAAGKKLPNEPPTETVLVCDSSLDVFIGKYQEVMRDIKTRHQQEQAQSKPNSYAAILAKHQQRANEQNQNKATVSPPRKATKKYSHDL